MGAISRRSFSGFAVAGGMGFTSAAHSAMPKPALRKIGKYNYRLRFVRRNRKMSVWTYVTMSRNWDASVAFTLLLSTDQTANQTAGANANSTFVVYTKQLLSDTTLSHTNRHVFEIPDVSTKTFFLRLLFGPEQALSRVWKVRLAK